MIEQIKKLMRCDDVKENPLPGHVTKEFVVTYSNGRKEVVSCKPRKNGKVNLRSLKVEPVMAGLVG
jgi:hypothetical protein